jgi:hypothetical protein
MFTLFNASAPSWNLVRILIWTLGGFDKLDFSNWSRKAGPFLKNTAEIFYFSQICSKAKLVRGL